MADPLDFQAYRRLHDAAEGAEALILRLRALAFAALDPEADQKLTLAEIVGELETAPEIARLRKALGRIDTLPPAVGVEED